MCIVFWANKESQQALVLVMRLAELSINTTVDEEGFRLFSFFPTAVLLLVSVETNPNQGTLQKIGHPDGTFGFSEKEC